MARAATPTELGYLRSSPQFSQVRAAIINPPAIFAAQINQTFTTRDSIATITIDNITTGAITDLVPGSTLWIGSAPGLCDIGQARVRKTASGAVIPVGEISEINLQDNLYVTGFMDFSLWAKPLRVQSNGTVKMDWDIAYTNQNTQWSPIPIMGPHAVLKLIGASVSTTWDAAGSWVPGGTISGYLWTAPGASSTSGLTTATPTFTYNAAGTYLVSLTITAATGKTATGWRYIVVRPAAETPSNIILNSCRGNWSQGGWEFNIRMYTGASISQVRDRALVILYADDYYGETKVSLGPIAGRENIIACGWITEEPLVRDPNGGYVEFNVAGPQYWLGNVTSFPLGLENVTKTPAAWIDVQRLTIDKGIAHYATWRSTAAAVTDVYPTGDTRIAPALISQASYLWQQLTTLTEQTVLAHPCCDRYGRIITEIDSQFIPLASRSGIPTVMIIQKYDTLTDIDIERAEHPKSGRLELSGIAITPGTSQAASFFSLAPGHVYKHYGAADTQDRLLLSSQAQANQLAGLILGYKNNPYPKIGIPLRSNNRLIDITPRQYVEIPVGAGDTPRGITFTRPRHTSGGIIRGHVGSVTDYPIWRGRDIRGFINQGRRSPDSPTISMPTPPRPPVIPKIPPIPTFPQDPTTAAPLGIMAVLVDGYGIYYMDSPSTPGSLPIWAPFTNLYDFSPATELTTMKNFHIAPGGICYMINRQAIYRQSMISPEPAVLMAGSSYFLGTYVTNANYYICAMGFNDSDPAGLALMVTDGEDQQFESAFTLSTDGRNLVNTFTIGGYAITIMNGGGNFTYYGGKWYQTQNAGANATAGLWRWKGDLTGLDVPTSIPIALVVPLGCFHIQAKNTGVMYVTSKYEQAQGAPSAIDPDTLVITNLPGSLTMTAADQRIACDPTGQHIMAAFNLSSSGDLLKSADYGATWNTINTWQSMSDDDSAPTAITNGKVVNLGNAGEWLFIFNATIKTDPITTVNHYLHIQYTNDFGATWTDVGGNLRELIGDETAAITIIRQG